LKYGILGLVMSLALVAGCDDDDEGDGLWVSIAPTTATIPTAPAPTRAMPPSAGAQKKRKSSATPQTAMESEGYRVGIKLIAECLSACVAATALVAAPANASADNDAPDAAGERVGGPPAGEVVDINERYRQLRNVRLGGGFLTAAAAASGCIGIAWLVLGHPPPEDDYPEGRRPECEDTDDCGKEETEISPGAIVLIVTGLVLAVPAVLMLVIPTVRMNRLLKTPVATRPVTFEGIVLLGSSREAPLSGMSLRFGF
jgi:hypothetical protein